MTDRLIGPLKISFGLKFFLPLPVQAFNLALVTLLLHLAFEGGVEVVLDVVVRAALEVLGDFRPSVAVLHMKVEDFLIFFFRPLVLFDVRIQVVMPAFPALLPDAPRKELSYLRPILRSIQLYTLNELSVLCF